MKKNTNYSIIAILLITSFLYMGCEKETKINEEQLPEQASLFIDTHFSGTSIAKVIKDKEGNKITYEITLANGINVDFDNAGKCISMDGHGKPLPDSSMPAKLVLYVQTNFPVEFITDWGLESFGQKVELSNETEIAFDMNGEFIKLL